MLAGEARKICQIGPFLLIYKPFLETLHNKNMFFTATICRGGPAEELERGYALGAF